MGIESDLTDFTTNFQQDVVARAESHAGADLVHTTFTRMMVEYLVEAQELEGGEDCYHKARGMEVSGYNVNEDEETLDLFISHFTAKSPPPTVTKTEIETRFKWVLAFLARALDGVHLTLEAASPAYDMAQRIHELKDTLTSVRVFLFTDGRTRGTWKPQKIHGLDVSYHIWDIVRLHRCVSSGRQREPIEINFEADFGGPIPCLESPGQDPECRVFMTLLPATILHRIYDLYGPRLLELNVRSFLQARGKVNQGIRTTLLKQPDRFLAYNNGISTTAEDIRLVALPGGGQGIAWVKNLQIVNGGQTTASIHHAVKKDKAVVDRVHVQAKLSVVSPASIAEVVPLISRYANSQNKVNEADFSANDPLHVRVQSLSRTIWAPATGGSQRQTRWFYERARGQYMDEKGRAGTPAKVRDFQAMNPPDQRFSKTDLAKFENTWDQLPHVVSLGGQKNFLEFTLRLAGGDPRPELTQRDFELVVARAILFRRAEQVVGKLDFGGYRANIVTYTLAYLSHRTSRRIDLDRVWREQDITPALEKVIAEVGRLVHEKLVNPPPGRKNVTEWCKKKECWEAVKLIECAMPEAFQKELLPPAVEDAARASAGRASRKQA
jgi:AIPR protein